MNDQKGHGSFQEAKAAILNHSKFFAWELEAVLLIRLRNLRCGLFLDQIQSRHTKAGFQ